MGIEQKEYFEYRPNLCRVVRPTRGWARSSHSARPRQQQLVPGPPGARDELHRARPHGEDPRGFVRINRQREENGRSAGHDVRRVVGARRERRRTRCAGAASPPGRWRHCAARHVPIPLRAHHFPMKVSARSGANRAMSAFF